MGDLFDQSPVVPIQSNFDLSDTLTTRFMWTEEISISPMSISYKSDLSCPAYRREIFYYALFGNDIEDKDGELGVGVKFMAMILLLTLGGLDLRALLPGFPSWTHSLIGDNIDSVFIDNAQASTLMHELGHNLGLSPRWAMMGQNYKPNYYSVMNYLYNGWSGPGLDFSDGSSIDLDENNLNEHLGIGRGLGSRDWNGNGTIESNVSHNLNPQESDNLSRLKDYDDWGNLYFYYYWQNNGNLLSSANHNAFVFETLSQEEDESQSWTGPCLCPTEHEGHGFDN